MSRNEYGYPAMDLYQVPMTADEIAQAEAEAEAEARLFLEQEDDMAEMYNYS